MSAAKEPLQDRFYRGLLRVLPFDFRSEFGDDMEETFREQRAATELRQGHIGVLKMWWATIADILRMAPREHVTVLAQDTRFALRMMRKNRAYTLAAVLILGLGIGANTSIFSVVNSVILKPLPYADGNRLVIVRQKGARDGVTDMPFSVAEINDYRQRNRSLTGLVEYHGMSFTLLGGTEPHQVRTGVVSAGFFNFFGVKPLLGRTFVDDEEKPGAQPVLVLSYEFWQNQERGDPNIIGKKYQMNDRAHIVIGVLPPIPQYPNENDVYMTTTSCPFRMNPDFIANRNRRMMSVFGRLKPWVTLNAARRDLARVAADLTAEYPASYTPQLGYGIGAVALREELTHDAKPLLWTLLGAAGFVLLIACANVANLILARMARREKELTIRTAMGAGAGRLLRQLLTESLLMALLAAAVGVAFAYGATGLLTRFAGQLTPRAREISLDGWVLGFAVLCATVTTVVCGTLAAMQTRVNVAGSLKENGAQSAPHASRSFVRSTLIAAQVAFSYMLLIGAGLMVHSMIQLEKVDPGFAPDHLFAVGIDLNFTKYPDGSSRRLAARRLLERVQAIPGVLSAACASSFPMDPDNNNFGSGVVRFRVYGDSRPDTELPPISAVRRITPDYFHTVGIPLVAGRTFRDSDSEKAPNVFIVSRSLAQRAWKNEDPIGKRITFDGEHYAEIVGVAGDVHEFGPGQGAPIQVYRPIAQQPFVGALLVRGAGDPRALIATVRRTALEANPESAVTKIQTLEEARSLSTASPRTTTRLFGLFAALALVIALAGIGSMLALWVRQRMREIGIRIALGAGPADILATVVRQGMVLVAIGLVCGLAGALALTRLLKNLLFEVTPTDAPTYAAVSVLLLAAALLACWVPARRAARIDPQIALRCE
ncbi:MAG TPA: ABC transporter permease [Candidatus Solibacter sp.]